MTDPIDWTDRALAAWLEDGPDRGRDEGLEAVLAATRGVSQRPAWTFPARWLPHRSRGRRPVAAARTRRGGRPCGLDLAGDRDRAHRGLAAATPRAVRGRREWRHRLRHGTRWRDLPGGHRRFERATFGRRGRDRAVSGLLPRWDEAGVLVEASRWRPQLARSVWLHTLPSVCRGRRRVRCPSSCPRRHLRDGSRQGAVLVARFDTRGRCGLGRRQPRAALGGIGGRSEPGGGDHRQATPITHHRPGPRTDDGSPSRS